ncbi:MAG: fluoride efflux transporter FluC [Thermoguttaceae bacterium]
MTPFLVLGVGVAGCLGALCRWGMISLVAVFLGTSYPWGTTLVNIVGCLACGIVVAMLDSCHAEFFVSWRVVILVGFFGSFTTFSALALETHRLATQGETLLALGNVVFQNVVGIAALAAGYAAVSFASRLTGAS